MESRLPTLAGALTTESCVPSAAEICARIKDLGFTSSRRIKLYGQHFDLISDPFVEGDCTAIRATCGNDPTIRTLRLPVAILMGLSDSYRKPNEGRAMDRLALRDSTPRDGGAGPASG